MSNHPDMERLLPIKNEIYTRYVGYRGAVSRTEMDASQKAQRINYGANVH